MPISKIQLKGISRVPSSRLTPDGMCAESLNVHLNQTETAPNLAPKDITESLGLASDGEFKPVYIHKLSGIDQINYIAQSVDDGSLAWLSVDPERTSPSWQPISGFENTPDTLDITSIGNTLIVKAAELHYFRFVDDSYLYLGTKVPEPKIFFECENQTSEDDEVELTYAHFGYETEYDMTHAGTERGIAAAAFTQNNTSASWTSLAAFQNNVLDNARKHVSVSVPSGDSYYTDTICHELAMTMWQQIQIFRNNLRAEKKFSAPLLARYAVRLYDGSYIYRSAPLLINGGDSIYFLAHILSGTGSAMPVKMRFRDIFTAAAHIKWDIGDWSDVVTSVDVFFSQDVLVPAPNTEISGRYTVGGTSLISFETETMISDDLVLDRLLGASSFFRVLSISTDTEGLSSGVTKELEPRSQDELVTNASLTEGFQDLHIIHPTGELLAFNSRLIASGAEISLYGGYPYQQATCKDASVSTSTLTFSYVVYTIKTSVGKTCAVYSESAVGGRTFSPPYTGAVVYGFVTYPDANCVSVDYYVGAGASASCYHIEMKPHPFLDCAYGYWGINLPLNYLAPATRTRPDMDSSYFDARMIFLSPANNPFTFPSEYWRSVPGHIYGMVPITVALSTGQYGQFDLYLFTDEGLWSINIKDDGTLGNPKPLPREVAIPGTISQLDNAAVFATDKGVMLLDRSNVRNLSSEMNGKHYQLEQDVKTMLEDTRWEDIYTEDDAPFMAFIKTAVGAYDYSGGRIIFFSAGKPYQYVFQMTEGSWHKMKFTIGGNAISEATMLNSYPDCYISAKVDDEYKIISLSTPLDVALEDDSDPTNDQPTLKGIAATRVINFGRDDLYKTIRRIYIRGDYAPVRTEGGQNIRAVQYILLASNDGRDFRILHSLRGPSWKYYRIILLTDLKPSDRISYIEIDWEERFLDRIR